MTALHDLSVVEQAAAIAAGQLSPVELTEHYLDRIGRLDGQVGAFVTVTAGLAREQAAAAQQTVAGHRAARSLAGLPPLTGVPVPVKDLNMLAGVRMALGSRVFAAHVADQDDNVVAALRAAGAVFTGKTATPEFGLPCYTETAIGPPARTPWDLSRSAGGSSGGAAAAVAAGLAPAAQGSDGGGSIRIPASACGLFGLKPSRGRVSGGPVNPDLSGLVTGGPITRTVADAALLLDVMAGQHPGDLYTQPPLAAGESFLACASREPGRLSIARTLGTVVPGADPHPDCVAAYEEASKLLASLGHEITDIELPFGADAMPAFETLWYAGASLLPVTDVQAGQLEPLTRYLRERGLALRAADLLAAEAFLQNLMRAALAGLAGYDALLTPTLAAPPAPVGYFTEAGPAENFERQKRFTPWTSLYNSSGQPAVTLPLYWNAAGLPIGVMLAGRPGEESTLISLSAQLEVASPWRDRHPPVWSA